LSLRVSWIDEEERRHSCSSKGGGNADCQPSRPSCSLEKNFRGHHMVATLWTNGEVTFHARVVSVVESTIDVGCELQISYVIALVPR
jgi:hypothetical protein